MREADRAALAHLRLHNGTIWRWNRSLIGFDDARTPHLRIEHRVMAAGTTIADMMANLAGFYGFAAALAHYDQARAPRLNAALTQGLRDYFGAHTYRRIDREGTFHVNWSTDGAEIQATDGH